MINPEYLQLLDCIMCTYHSLLRPPFSPRIRRHDGFWSLAALLPLFLAMFIFWSGCAQEITPQAVPLRPFPGTTGSGTLKYTPECSGDWNIHVELSGMQYDENYWLSLNNALPGDEVLCGLQIPGWPPGRRWPPETGKECFWDFKEITVKNGNWAGDVKLPLPHGKYAVKFLVKESYDRGGSVVLRNDSIVFEIIEPVPWLFIFFIAGPVLAVLLILAFIFFRPPKTSPKKYLIHPQTDPVDLSNMLNDGSQIRIMAHVVDERRIPVPINTLVLFSIEPTPETANLKIEPQKALTDKEGKAHTAVTIGFGTEVGIYEVCASYGSTIERKPFTVKETLRELVLGFIDESRIIKETIKPYPDDKNQKRKNEALSMYDKNPKRFKWIKREYLKDDVFGFREGHFEDDITSKLLREVMTGFKKDHISWMKASRPFEEMLNCKSYVALFTLYKPLRDKYLK